MQIPTERLEKLSIPELKQLETNLVESIIIHNDKLILEQRAVAEKRVPLTAYLVTRDLIESRIDKESANLQLVRHAIENKYKTTEFI